jgi:riboflavin kinase
LHEFVSDFYGDDIRIIVTGYIRPEQNYPSLGKLKREINANAMVIICMLTFHLFYSDALICDIKTDIEVAKHSLQREAYSKVRNDALFTQ